MKAIPVLLASLAAGCLLRAEPTQTPMPADATPFTWQSATPADCPFPKSRSLTGITFTGRHSNYKCGDTWYPSWASDGNLYSPWTDGSTDGVSCSSGAATDAMTGHAG